MAKTRSRDENAANNPVTNEELTTMSQLMKTIISLSIVAAAALKLRGTLRKEKHASAGQVTTRNAGQSLT